MSRETFNKVGGRCIFIFFSDLGKLTLLRRSAYDETYPGCPEDLIFFYAHLGKGGTLHKVEKVRRIQPRKTQGVVYTNP